MCWPPPARACQLPPAGRWPPVWTRCMPSVVANPLPGALSSETGSAFTRWALTGGRSLATPARGAAAPRDVPGWPCPVQRGARWCQPCSRYPRVGVPTLRVLQQTGACPELGGSPHPGACRLIPMQHLFFAVTSVTDIKDHH